MGSLMPGWDSVNSGQSYLERVSSKGQPGEVPEWLNNIRVERTQSSDQAPNTLGRTSSTSTNFATRTSSEGGAQLPHFGAAGSKTLPHRSGGAKVVHAQPKLSLKRTSLPVTMENMPRSSLADQGHEHEEGEEQNDTADHGLMSDHIRWWKNMDSGHLNTAHEADYADYRHGSYVPQHGVARKHLPEHCEGTEQPAH